MEKNILSWFKNFIFIFFVFGIFFGNNANAMVTYVCVTNDSCSTQQFNNINDEKENFSGLKESCISNGGKWVEATKGPPKECNDISEKNTKGSQGITDTGNYGLEGTARFANLPKSGSIASITGKIIGAVLSLVGILFFLLMLYGGIIWMTARGDEAQTKKARDIIFSAVVGLIIISAAGILTSFVFKSVL